MITLMILRPSHPKDNVSASNRNIFYVPILEIVLPEIMGLENFHGDMKIIIVFILG